MAAGSTYSTIMTNTLGSAAASYTLSSIPSTYTDLILVIDGSTVSNIQFRMRVGNGSVDTNSNYGGTQLYGYATTAGSGRETNATNPYIGASSTTNSTHIIQFMNYANTNVLKTWLTKGGDMGSNQIDLSAYCWRSTSAINTIQISGNGGNISSGTTFTLYGISAA